MVDVSAKPATARRAVASALVRIGAEAYSQLERAALPKGDALATAKIAGIIAAKKTSELIPLCHGLLPEYVDVRFERRPPDSIRIVAEARVEGKTGVELEALTAASIAALTLYDMCKAVTKDIVIGPIQLEEKTGGKSDWRRTRTLPEQPRD
ncbi:Cyclic pyranopterin monophosphate synthase accessory protein [Phycisphaerae bacterium RAS1]|nr:Cyclic pyranopterin monophosphate synthase accessory protein [Phycisphaerae bacterium RAS1]